MHLILYLKLYVKIRENEPFQVKCCYYTNAISVLNSVSRCRSVYIFLLALSIHRLK